MRSFLSRAWHSVRRVLEERVFGTKLQEAIWRFRHLFRGKGWIEDYLASIDHPHRTQIAAAVAAFEPESALEVGCNAGPNLAVLLKARPGIRLIGIDINSAAIEIGKKHFAHHPNVELRVGTAADVAFVGSGAVDVVFSDALFMFIAQDKAQDVAREMVRVARRGIVLNEFHRSGSGSSYEAGRWVHDLEALFKIAAPDARITRTRSDFTGGQWDSFGTLLVVSL